jgi:hypothetical protein
MKNSINRVNFRNNNEIKHIILVVIYYKALEIFLLIIQLQIFIFRFQFKKNNNENLYLLLVAYIDQMALVQNNRFR